MPVGRVNTSTQLSSSALAAGRLITHVDITMSFERSAVEAKNPYAPGHGSVAPAIPIRAHVPSEYRLAISISWVVGPWYTTIGAAPLTSWSEASSPTKWNS